eukprot:CAMPEP_0117753108 /NCGR_PEP_ID=MMETSP0947-20121206/12026_1 /TAXON_ID=44440 /ORGANISM="Chattonella subsalsa, Strain CCMP2191" /LENGTH=1008 /DNA_ID=CAMNT_0005571921 /DNA_START=114 /DNA_END=3140 /DNA_ORIENTATION=-
MTYAVLGVILGRQQLCSKAFRMLSLQRTIPQKSFGFRSLSMKNDWSSSVVRQTFLDYFVKKQDHTNYPSSPVVPLSDPTLLFANAGMNQFKPIFLGQTDPSSPLASLKRAVNTQKCIRAGGKHNDLEDVGKDTYHHTFFEMLGTWSFNGDYFKKEAISWAFEILTQEYGLDSSRLYATYFGGDEVDGLEADTEARDFWLQFLPPERVLACGKKDNFWEMGDVGPCGPCSELHYDRIGGRDAAALVNADDPNVIEIWNLVFIQYNREEGGQLKLLPNKHVDTGMGFERLVSVLQDKSSNYDTDVFTPLFSKIQDVTGAAPYEGKLGEEDINLRDTAYRVLADHVRTLTFAIADGAIPSNEGRGYVLRRILRRAVRFGQQILGAEKGFFQKLVPVVIENFSDVFPELKEKQDQVEAIIKDEEDSFSQLLERGVKYFKEMELELKSSKTTQIPGNRAFYLYDTLGFPVDLTQLMAEEVGLSVDISGFEAEMDQQKQRSRDAGKKKIMGNRGNLALGAEQTAELASKGLTATDDAQKYSWDVTPSAKIVGIYNYDGFVERMESGEESVAGILLESTSFYAEAGGQVADSGEILIKDESGATLTVVDVQDVQSFAGYILHIGTVKKGEVKVGDEGTLSVDYVRRKKTAPNHTMTHVMNYALLKVLGSGVDQRGSLVNEEKLRFDFSHNKPMSPKELANVESIVNNVIQEKKPVYNKVVPLSDAKAINGLRAVFGEVYPDPVRVVSVGYDIDELTSDPEKEEWASSSIEFCGGTHIDNTEEAEAFVLTEETGIAKGIRRLSGITGADAVEAIKAGAIIEEKVTEVEKSSEGPEVVEKLVVSLRQEVDDLLISASLKPVLRSRLEKVAKEALKKKKQASQAAIDKAIQKLKDTLTNEGLTDRKVIVMEVGIGVDSKAVKNVLNVVGKMAPQAAFMGLSVDQESGKLLCFASVPEDLVAQGLKAGEWVMTGLEPCGGRGGGRPNMAQGQAPSAENILISLENAKKFAAKFETASVP